MGGGSLNNKNNVSYKKKCIISGITGIIIGTVITGGIGVAAVTLTADQIKYAPQNEKYTATNAKEAFDELYKIGEYKISEDTYFYDSSTSGDEIVRYRKIDGKYYLCDEKGKVTNEISQDVSDLTLIEYSSTNQNNISTGKAGYASGNLYLGNGVDLKNSKEVTFNIYGSYFDYNIDVSKYSQAVIQVSTKHQYVDSYIYLDGTLVKSYTASMAPNETITLDVSEKSTMRIYSKYHASYSEVDGKKYTITLK